MPWIAGHGESSTSQPKTPNAFSRFWICSRVSSWWWRNSSASLASWGLVGVLVEHLEHGLLHLQRRAELEVVELLGGVESFEHGRPVPGRHVAHSTERALAAGGGEAPWARAFRHTQYRRLHVLKRRTTLIIISLFALLVPAAMAQAKPEIAIQDEDVFVDGKTLGPTQGYERLAELGVHRMRILVSSDSVETGG